MSQPNGNTPSKRAPDADSTARTPGRTPITPSRRARTDSQPTISQQNPRTPNRNSELTLCIQSNMIVFTYLLKT